MVQSDDQPGRLSAYIQKLKGFSHNAWMVLTASLLTGIGFGVFRLLLNFYVLSLGGYDQRFLGTLTSVTSGAALVSAIPAAYLAERFSQKRIMLIAALLGACALLGLVLLPYRAPLIGFSILNGLAQSLYMVTASPFLMRNTSKDVRLYVFSLNFGFRTFAEFVGNMFGGMLPAWLGGLAGIGSTSTPAYQLAIGAAALASFLSVLPLALIRVLPPDPDRPVAMPWNLAVQNFGILTKVITPNLMIGLGAGLMMPFMNVYFRNVFERPDDTIGFLFALSSAAMATTQFVAAPLADRIGKINTVVLAQGLSIPFLMTMGIAAWAVPAGWGSRGMWFFIAAAAFLTRTALMNLGSPVYTTFVMEQVKPEVQALAASLTGIAFQFGWVLSPNLSGWFQATYGDEGFVRVFSTTSALYVVGIIVTWVLFHNAEKTIPSPAASATGE